MYCQRCTELCEKHAAEADARTAEFDLRDKVERLAKVLCTPFPPLVLGVERPKIDQLETKLVDLKLAACELLLPLIARPK